MDWETCLAVKISCGGMKLAKDAELPPGTPLEVHMTDRPTTINVV
ncbi:MAG: hypothetical protein AAGK37_00330 [Pseudomonadota bacterium]